MTMSDKSARPAAPRALKSSDAFASSAYLSDNRRSRYFRAALVAVRQLESDSRPISRSLAAALGGERKTLLKARKL